MCSSRSARSAALLAGLALWLPLTFGCGHKDDPKPPPQKIPQTIRDLTVSQRGNELELEFTYPQVTISGQPIDDIVAVEIWEYEVAVPDFVPDGGGDDDADTDEPSETEDLGGDDREREEESAGTLEDESPLTEDDDTVGDGDYEDDEDEDEDERIYRPSKETLVEVDPREFSAAARLRLALEGDALTSAIRGADVVVTLELDEIEPGETSALIFGVKSFQSLNRASGFSNLFKIIPRVTPDPPAEVELEAVANGIKLSWEEPEEEPVEYRFYRRDPKAPGFGDHFATREGDGDQFLDSTAEAGRSYIYALTLVVNRQPLVESALATSREIEYLDVFPPAAPTDLVVLTEVGAARLLWEGSSDDDVAGYAIYRRTGGAEFSRLNDELASQNEYSDTSVESGRSYGYRIVAVDREGNLSDPSEEIQVRIP